MSTENSENETTTETTAEEPIKSSNNLLNTVLELKESNPKILYGAIAGIVGLLLIIVMSGGSSDATVSHKVKNLTVGSNYVLQGANSYAENATVSLAVAPGTIAAFGEDDDSETDTACKQIPQGTPIKIIDMQKTTGVNYANVEILKGTCQGRKGWALSIDIQ